MRIAAVIVAYKTPKWIQIAVKSFRKHLPDIPLLVVDNNPDGPQPEIAEERDWLRRQSDITVIRSDCYQPVHYREHGAGIDAGAEWCRRHNYDVMLHLEPDCLVRGRVWYNRLYEAIQSGAWMAGSWLKGYGPIHPTPSMWRLSEAKYSFCGAERAVDGQHPRFAELFDADLLFSECTTRQWEGFWAHRWDTSQRNWFFAAAADKAVLVQPSDDFVHFWYGSQKHTNYPGFTTDPELFALLEN